MIVSMRKCFHVFRYRCVKAVNGYLNYSAITALNRKELWVRSN